jgi:hypothetical protein
MTDHSRFTITRTGIGIRSGKPTVGRCGVTGTLEQAMHDYRAHIAAAKTYRKDLLTVTLTDAAGTVLETWA